jgi:hypothetical protein
VFPYPQINFPDKWEYLSVIAHGRFVRYVNGFEKPELKHEFIELYLNTLGKAGWELVHVWTNVGEETFVEKYYLKRVLK